MKFMIIFFSLFTSCQIINSQSSDSPKNNISSELGKTFQIELPSNVSTGNTWVLHSEMDKQFLQLEATEYKETETNLDGAPGLDVFTFKTLAKGKTTLEFVYKYAWEKETPENAPKRTFQITIH